MTKGFLIAIDGIDGVGKTTLARSLAASFPKTVNTLVTKEPTDGEWGNKLRASASSGRLSKETELHLLTMDRKDHVNKVIVPALNAGQIVVLDRYTYSTAAYQSESSDDAIKILEEQFSFAPVPNLTFIIDAPVDVALSRISSRGDVANHFERSDTLHKCRDIFIDVVCKRPEVLLIDGTLSPDDVVFFARKSFLSNYAGMVKKDHGLTVDAAEILSPLFSAHF